MSNQETVRVLIAEDNSLVSQMIEVLLEEIGYTVVGGAVDGLEAVEMTQSIRPDVVLMDIRMPHMDGIEATRRIYESCPTPVVMLTAYETPEMVEEASAAGAGAYLVKPPNTRELEYAITIATARFGDMMALRRLNAELQAEITERKRAEEALEQRAAQLALLNDIGGKIAAVLKLDSVLDRAARLMQESFGYHHVALFTVDHQRGELVMRARAGDFAHLFPSEHRLKLDQGLVGWVGRHGERLLANDVDAEPRYVNLYPDVIPTRSELSVPIRVGEEMVGVLDVQSPQRNAFDENDVMVMETLAHQIAIAIENARLYEAEHSAWEQLRSLASYLQTAREEERTYIAREIHDEFGQMLTALKMDLSWIAKRLPEDEAVLREKADLMSGLIDSTIQIIRRIATELRPGLLDDLGLVAAVEWQAREFAERAGIECELYLSDEEIALDRDLATAIFRIFQETLTNVARHAEATEIRVELEEEPDQLVLTVRDNGQGITESQVSDPRSLGLVGVRERARPWGGDVTFQGVPGQGTTVTVRVPRANAKEGRK